MRAKKGARWGSHACFRDRVTGPKPPKGPPMGRVISFANQKGGVAKTTTTLNLGVALAEQDLRVLLCDLDPQGNLTMSQGLNPDTMERSMFDVLVHRLPIEEVIHHTEVDLAVSSIDLAGAELALSSMIGRERALEKALGAGAGQLRLRPDRHAAVARPADDQRARRLERRDRARSSASTSRCAGSSSSRTRSR